MINMIITNKTKSFVVSEDAGWAGSFLRRLRGLMFTRRPRDLVIVSPRESVLSSSIHMMFMSYPLDVVWLDSSKKVVDLRSGVQPFSLLKPSTWRIHKPGRSAKYVVELGVGELGKTEIGDELEFREDM